VVQALPFRQHKNIYQKLYQIYEFEQLVYSFTFQNLTAVKMRICYVLQMGSQPELVGPCNTSPTYFFITECVEGFFSRFDYSS